MNQRLLAVLGRVVFAAGMAIATTTPSQASPVPPQSGTSLVAQQPTRRPPRVTNSPVPDVIGNVVLQDLSQQTGVPLTALRITEAQQTTWPDGCLGLGSAGLACAQTLVPGWRVVVAHQQQRWVYRTNLYGSVVKLDVVESQKLAGISPPTTSQLPANGIPPSGTLPSNRIQPPVAPPVIQAQEKFSLAIWQPSGTFTDVIARISLKSRNGNIYAPERFVGDFRYRPNQRAKFTGVNAGDRIVVRLYNFPGRLIGFSEFDVLAPNIAVNLILGKQPTFNRMVRTVYGVDVNEDATLDSGVNVYDYFTQVTGGTAGEEQVTFVNNVPDNTLTWFLVAGLPVPPRQSVFPASLKNEVGGVGQSRVVYTNDLSPLFTAAPGQQVQFSTLSISNSSTYNVSQLVTNAPVASVNRLIQTPPTTPVTPLAVSFPDVPSNYWAKDFIAQLAAKKILQGYPDGLYQPNAHVTRAELASILNQAFNRPKVRDMVVFKDVSTTYWAYPAIKKAYEMGFFAMNAQRVFNPDQNVSRLDVLVALARGLNYSPKGNTVTVLRVYRDSASIPRGDRNLVAAVTERGIVVNYPNVKVLNPQRQATRAEVAALIYQALVSTGQAGAISSPYVVGANTVNVEIESVEQSPPAQQRRRTPVRQHPTNNPSTQSSSSVHHTPVNQSNR